MNVNKSSQNIYNYSIYSSIRVLRHIEATRRTNQTKRIESASKNKIDYPTIVDEEILTQKKEVLKSKKEEPEKTEVKLSWLAQLISAVSGAPQRIQQIYTKMRYQASPPKAGPILTSDLALEVKKYLTYSDLAHLEEINKETQDKLKNAWIQEAQLYGYEGNDASEAKKYLSDLLSEINTLHKEANLPEAILIYKEIDGKKSLDAEGTLRRLKSITTKELFKEFSTTELQNTFKFLTKIKSDCTQTKEFTEKETKPANKMWGTAIRSQNLEFIKFLVSQGADVNAKLPDKNTPLILACQFSASTLDGLLKFSPEQKMLQKNVVKFLLDQGANPKVSDKKGNTPLFYANKSNNSEIVELLKQQSDTS